MLRSADQFQITLHWLAGRALVSGREFLLCFSGQQLCATVTALKFRIDQVTGEHLYTKSLHSGEVGVANISTATALTMNCSQDSVLELRDRETQELVARVQIDFALQRATNIRWQNLTVDKVARAQAKNQRPRCIWFTGLSGSGKSTIANLLEKKLFDQGFHTYLLDGDNLRHGLNRDLGFTEADRVENIRRVAEVSRLMVDAGLIVLASFISPFDSERQMARRLFNDGEFIEVFVDTPLTECERRDVKGLYAKARRGELKNFTGIDSAYERPQHAELVVDTCAQSAEQCVAQIIGYIEADSPAQ